MSKDILISKTSNLARNADRTVEVVPQPILKSAIIASEARFYSTVNVSLATLSVIPVSAHQQSVNNAKMENFMILDL